MADVDGVDVAYRLSRAENDLLLISRKMRDTSIYADRLGVHTYAAFYDEIVHQIDLAANEVARAYNLLVDGNDVVPSIREDV